MVLGDREVVHHHRDRQVDVDGPGQGAVGVDHVVPQVRRDGRVSEREHLAGVRIDLRVGGERSVQATTEVRRADRREVDVEHGGRARLPQAQDLTGVAHHMGVGDVLDGPRIADEVRPGEGGVRHAAVQRMASSLLRRHPLAADPTVAIARPSVRQRELVDHAVAVEQVVRAGRGEQRVRSVAQEGALQLRRDLAGHLEVDRVDLVLDRRVHPLQVGLDVPFLGDAHVRPPVASRSCPTRDRTTLQRSPARRSADARGSGDEQASTCRCGDGSDRAGHRSARRVRLRRRNSRPHAARRARP